MRSPARWPAGKRFARYAGVCADAYEKSERMLWETGSTRVPTVFIMNYVQARHLDLDFYDHHCKPGAYLRTRAEHMECWHGVGRES